jgi:hypothetical protein
LLCFFTSWVQGETLVNFFKGLAPVSANSKRTGPAAEAHYQFLTWLMSLVEKFPRSHTFTIGDRATDNRNNNNGFRVGRTVTARAGAITVASDAH